MQDFSLNVTTIMHQVQFNYSLPLQGIKHVLRSFLKYQSCRLHSTLLVIMAIAAPSRPHPRKKGRRKEASPWAAENLFIRNGIGTTATMANTNTGLKCCQDQNSEVPLFSEKLQCQQVQLSKLPRTVDLPSDGSIQSSHSQLRLLLLL